MGRYGDMRMNARFGLPRELERSGLAPGDAFSTPPTFYTLRVSWCSCGKAGLRLIKTASCLMLTKVRVFWALSVFVMCLFGVALMG